MRLITLKLQPLNQGRARQNINSITCNYKVQRGENVNDRFKKIIQSKAGKQFAKPFLEHLKHNSEYIEIFNKDWKAEELIVVFPSNDKENQLKFVAPTTITPSTPLLLLSFDGVVNYVGNGELPYNDVRSEDLITSRMKPEKIRWSPTVINKLNALAEKVEIRWMTPRMNSINTRIAPALGLAGFHVGNYDCSDLTENELIRPLIWIDNNVQPYQSEHLIKKCKYPSKIICPVSGLTDDDFKEIEEYIMSSSLETQIKKTVLEN